MSVENYGTLKGIDTKKEVDFDTPHNQLDGIGEDNDLNNFIEKYMFKVIRENATVYIYGSKFGPENKKDKIFGFKPTNGMHNIHMNQGNSGRWKKDNGITMSAVY